MNNKGPLFTVAAILFCIIPFVHTELGSTAFAQSEPLGDPGARPGLWLPWRVDVTGFPQYGISTADRKAVAEQLAAVASVVRASPALADLRGIYPELTGSLMPGGAPTDEKHFKSAPLGGTIILAVWVENQIDRVGNSVSVKKEWRYNGPASLVIALNRPIEPNAEPWMQDEQGRFFPLDEGRPIGGFPVQFEHVIVSKNGRPLYLPVTKERLIKAYIVKIEPAARTVPEYKRQLNEAQALLAKLSDAEKKQPAWRKNGASKLDLVPEGSANARPLVEVNRAFFDPKLPRAALQVLLVRIEPHASQRAAGSKLLAARASMAVIERTDWRKALR
ncbi:MAG TPA: hypothetical protein VJH03_02520 [Blastocatellia bacterium]|nr:hypothetical protein [Blastocatellia bacterium]